MLAQVLNQFGDEVPDLDDAQRLKVAGRRDQRVARCRPPAGLPRPQRRRSLGRGLRDGFCRSHGPQPQRRPAGHRERRHCRQPCRDGRLQELGRPGQRAPQRADAEGAVQRGAWRADPGAERAARRRDGGAAQAWPVEPQPCRRQAQPQRAWSRSGATPRPLFSAPLRELQQSWDEVSWRIARLRDNPACADSEHEHAGRRRRRRPAPATELRSGRGRRGAIPQPRASEVGDPARAGRQLACRDEPRARPRRLRDLRRAHERPAGRPCPARAVQGLHRLRRFQLRRHARRRRGLGPLGDVQPGAGRAVRGLLRARRQLRARRLQRLPDDGRAEPDHSRRPALAASSPATRANSSRRG